jgi:hypothetical protein
MPRLHNIGSHGTKGLYIVYLKIFVYKIAKEGFKVHSFTFFFAGLIRKRSMLKSGVEDTSDSGN